MAREYPARRPIDGPGKDEGCQEELNSRFSRSTGNVFRDVGFPREQAEHLLIRADLLIQLEKAIVSRRLKQAEVAKILNVSQPRVSDLRRGRLQLFSTDMLIDMLARLGIHVRLIVKPTRRRRVA